ncbi:2Fe-2S iron-sulfur cluster binding domain-containing protein [Haloarcula rubripromontorii]|uniref:2Fe-2S iron-sulfur cluster binding domain-containing protein n=1 Tax=Haloarcula rubripromontorii TaxID=1705562 RepID=A0A847THR8_9EURY|nr:2Fe-2S iron-sulfur cluster-binding protein [Haloarcula rubripromontorii]NLV05402.1 2Fe-2S iron-sulfur cluster binding domain-containing protein [Haloarcula rubripromontorii]
MTEVLLDWRDSDRTETVSVPDGETILDAAAAADIGLPFGCRTGACGTCTARLLSGDVVHHCPPRALKDRHLADGYVLLCIAEPRTDAHLAVGATVQAELVPNPWK